MPVPISQFQLIYSCTPAQLETLLVTTLPAAGFQVIRAPQRFQGIILGSTGGAAGMGQVDFSYDGQFFIRIFTSAPIPAPMQSTPGQVQNGLSPSFIAYFNATVAATLGAPVAQDLATQPKWNP